MSNFLNVNEMLDARDRILDFLFDYDLGCKVSRERIGKFYLDLFGKFKEKFCSDGFVEYAIMQQLYLCDSKNHVACDELMCFLMELNDEELEFHALKAGFKPFEFIDAMIIYDKCMKGKKPNGESIREIEALYRVIEEKEYPESIDKYEFIYTLDTHMEYIAAKETSERNKAGVKHDAE